MGRYRSLGRALGRVRTVLDSGERARLAVRRPARPPSPPGGDGRLFRACDASSAALPCAGPQRTAVEGDDRGNQRDVQRLALVLPRTLRRLRRAVRAAADDAVRQFPAGRHPDRAGRRLRAGDELRHRQNRRYAGTGDRHRHQSGRAGFGRARQSPGHPEFHPRRGRGAQPARDQRTSARGAISCADLVGDRLGRDARQFDAVAARDLPRRHLAGHSRRDDNRRRSSPS